MTANITNSSNQSPHYLAGYDCGLHGANEWNCHFGHFTHPSRTSDWERGKRDAEANRKDANHV